MKISSLKPHLGFITLLSLGISYFSLLYFSFHKAVTGFFMQLVFVYEQVRAGKFALSNSYSPEFWLNLLIGPLVLYFSFLIIKAVFKSLSQLISTHRYLRTLNSTFNSPYYLFSSSDPQAFTAGLVRPRIYVSSSLLKLCTPDELKSIILHETHHQHNFDPAKSFVINFLNSSLPDFPGKSYLFNLYTSTIEISCDNYAVSNLKTPKPLASALFKLLNQSPSVSLVSAFSASSTRIHSLIQGHNPSLKSFYFSSILSVLVLTFLSFSVHKSTFFYECHHLLECISLITQSKSITTEHQSCADTQSFPESLPQFHADVCQQTHFSSDNK